MITRHTLNEWQGGKFRLLLVEDNFVNQKVAVRMLEKMGFRCDVAANGLEALESLARIPYHAILMDCHMPQMDGFEATRTIRKKEGKSKHTPIIAMTAGVMEADRRRCMEGRSRLPAGTGHHFSGRNGAPPGRITECPESRRPELSQEGTPHNQGSRRQYRGRTAQPCRGPHGNKVFRRELGSGGKGYPGSWRRVQTNPRLPRESSPTGIKPGGSYGRREPASRMRCNFSILAETGIVFAFHKAVVGSKKEVGNAGKTPVTIELTAGQQARIKKVTGQAVRAVTVANVGNKAVLKTARIRLTRRASGLDPVFGDNFPRIK